MEKSYLIGENGLYWRKNVLHRRSKAYRLFRPIPQAAMYNKGQGE